MIEKEGRKCLTIPFDLTNLKSVDKIIKKHMDTFGALDIVVNNASQQMMCKNFEEIDLGFIPFHNTTDRSDSVEETFRSNILQMFAVTKFALPHLKKGSSIINTTSVTAYRGSPAMVDYAATKGAIVSFTRSLAKQLAPKGIRVNAVAPGPVHTPLQPASRSPDEMEKFGEKSLLGRPAQPSEIAPSYVWLASAEAAYYVGAVLHPSAEVLNN